MSKQAKRGRKKGSYSFIMVLMSELKKQIRDTDMVVLSSKFAESAGITGQPVKTVAGSSMMIPVMNPAPASLTVPKKLDTVEVKEDNEDSTSLQIDVQDW